MKKHLGIFTIALSTITFAAYSQADDKKEKELEKAQESDRARSTQGIRTDNELKDDRGEVQSNQYRKSESDSVSNQGTSQDGEDLVLEKNQDQGLSSDDDGNGLTNENNTTQRGEQRTNTPAVIQTTTSESGSPAILSGEDGAKRDGTNNVQRAKPNIAGAKEPGKMNPAKNPAGKNRKTDAPGVRKHEEQPGQSGNTASQQSDGNVVKITQSTVNSDSTTHQQETASPATAKEERKAKRKARRNNRKD